MSVKPDAEARRPVRRILGRILLSWALVGLLFGGVSLVRWLLRPDIVLLAEVTIADVRWELLGVPEGRSDFDDFTDGPCVEVKAFSARDGHAFGGVGSCGLQGVKLTSEGFESVEGDSVLEPSGGGTLSLDDAGERTARIAFGVAVCDCDLLYRSAGGDVRREPVRGGAYFWVDGDPRGDFVDVVER